MMTKSSAKRMQAIFNVSNCMPRPEALSKAPNSLMNRQNSNGDRLHPEIGLLLLYVNLLILYVTLIVFNLPFNILGNFTAEQNFFSFSANCLS